MGEALLAAAPMGTVAADEVMIEEAGYGGLFGRKREVQMKKRGVVIECSVVCVMVLPVTVGDLAALVAETVVVVVAAAAHVQP